MATERAGETTPGATRRRRPGRRAEWGRVAVVRRLGGLVAAGLAAGGTLWAASLVSAPAQPAGAVTTGQFSLEPSTPSGSRTPRSDMSYVLKPGQRFSDSVQLSNFTAKAQTFAIYGADGYNIPQGGGLGLRPLGYHDVGVGAWVHLPTNRYTVPAHTTATFPVEVEVPADASPGDHVGGIVALDESKIAGHKGPVKVKVHRGVAVAVYVRVIGPLHPGVAVTAVGARASESPFAFAGGDSRATVYATIRDTGNVQLRAEVKVDVTDAFGRTVKTFAPVQVPVLVPGDTFTVLEPPWRSLPIAGPEHVHVTVVTNRAGTATAGGTFWVVPWVLVGIVLAVLALLVAWLWWRRRRRRDEVDPGHGPGEPGEPEAPEGPHEPGEELVGARSPRP